MTAKRTFQTIGAAIAAAFVILLAGPLSGSGALAGIFKPTVGDLNESRYWDTVVEKLPDGKVLLAMGGDSTDQKETAELYDPTTGTFSPTGSLLEPRTDTSHVLMENGKVLVAGGASGSGSITYDRSEIYDPATGQFTLSGPLESARFEAATVLLPNGKVLVVGGQSSNYPYPKYSSAELFDPATGTFSYTGSMSGIRINPAIALLPNGKVLVAGGRTSNDSSDPPLGTAEIYDPATGAFSPTGSMPADLAGSEFARSLPGGKVLVLGRTNGTAALYNPANGTFTQTGTMVKPGFVENATVMSDGRVLIIGASNYSSSSSVEWYDPASGTFKSETHQSGMSKRRGDPAVALLDDGNVLVAGGLVRDYGSPFVTELVSAEIYVPDGVDPRLTISKSGTGSGLVKVRAPVSAGSSFFFDVLTCGTLCAGDYRYGDSFEILASPDSDSTFDGWSGACAGTGSCEVTMEGAREINAIFTKKPVTIPDPDPGTAVLSTPRISPAAKTVARGRKVAFTVMVGNFGDGTARDVNLCATGPRKLVKTGPCITFPALDADSSQTAKYPVTVLKKARKKAKATITFKVTASNASGKARKATVRVK